MTLQQALDWAYARNQRIAELENEAENCKNYCLKLSKTVTEQTAEIDRLEAEVERLRPDVVRYRNALSDIQEHSANLPTDSYAMQKIADAAMRANK